jgi:hypothetical protein
MGATKTSVAKRRDTVFTLPTITLFFTASLLLGLTGRAQNVHSADAFVDSIGLNIHLIDADSPYGDFSAVERTLRTLGIRHVRDGLIDTQWMPYFTRMNTLGRDGIKCIFITNPHQTIELLQSYPDRMKDSFEGYEAPNESDDGHDKDWAANLNRFLPDLAIAARTGHRGVAFPIIGPSFVHAESYSALRGTSQYFDFANLHNYFAGRNPGTAGWGSNGYGSLSWDFDLIDKAWPGLPVVTTETGYRNDLSDPQGIPDSVAAKYLPRLLLEQYARGIRRTYIYELADVTHAQQGIHNEFGLVRSDFSPKPAYLAIQHLIALLADPGPAWAPRDLALSLSGELSNVHHLLFAKRDGTYLLAIWQEVPGYDVNSKKILPVPPQQVMYALPNPFLVEQMRLNEDGSLAEEAPDLTSRGAISVDDRVTLLKITPPSTAKKAPAVRGASEK